jgi:hypothetical protein
MLNRMSKAIQHVQPIKFGPNNNVAHIGRIRFLNDRDRADSIPLIDTLLQYLLHYLLLSRFRTRA